MAKAGGVFRGHAALCDVVGVETQMLQVGKVGDCDVLAETCQVKLYRGSKMERKLDINRHKMLC